MFDSAKDGAMKTVLGHGRTLSTRWWLCALGVLSMSPLELVAQSENRDRTPQHLPFHNARHDGPLGSAPARPSTATRRAIAVEDAQTPEPSSRKRQTSTPLPKPSSRSTSSKPVVGIEALSTVAASLAMVIGAFLLLVIALRRGNSRHQKSLPSEVFEVLGRKAVNHKTQLQLLRIGSKLVLVSVTSDGMETVSEIDQPAEVDRIAGLCRQKHAGSITRSFAEILGGAATSPEELTARRRRR